MDKSKLIREQMNLIKNLGKINESKVATDDSPIGYYNIANALMPTELFDELDKLDIEYNHNTYANFIEIFVKDVEEGKKVRELVLDIDVFEADDVDLEFIEHDVEEGDEGDMLEIKMK